MSDDPDMLGEEPLPEAAQQCHRLEPRALFGRGDRAFGPRKRCTLDADHDGACSWDREDSDAT